MRNQPGKRVLAFVVVVIVLLFWAGKFLLGQPAGPRDASTKCPKPVPSPKATAGRPLGQTTKKGFHFIFKYVAIVNCLYSHCSTDCYYSQAVSYNYISFMLFHSFLLYYPEDSGHTITGMDFAGFWSSRLF
jgi:hypothetical protein